MEIKDVLPWVALLPYLALVAGYVIRVESTLTEIKRDVKWLKEITTPCRHNLEKPTR